MKTTLQVLLTTALLTLAYAGSAQAQGIEVLVFHGPQDATTTAGVEAIEALGTANGFGVDATGLASDITATKLAEYRAVVFLNTAGDLLNAEQEGALQAFVEAGNGFLGIGSAAQGESGAFFDGLIGARPAASSPAGESQQLVIPGDRVHPSTRELPLKWTRNDVWYAWQTRPTGSVHVVARYRAPGAPAGDGTQDTAGGDPDQPISWCRDYRGGRSFYTGMGRTAAAYGEANFAAHLEGALEWTTGLIRTDCKATINANYKGTKLMSAGDVSTGLATSGESHGLATADNGWVLYIGRGDCRTDGERGSLLGLSSLARSLDHSSPNVGLGCGSVHIFDPAQYTGAENSGVTLAGKLAVYGDGGQGGERTDEEGHKMEYGLLGIAADPNFSENGWVYLQYFPSFNPNSTPPGLPVERRISKLSRPRISRFTINRQTKQLDLASEKRIFEYDAQIYSCCHVGGGMGFDSEGNLYVTTGDTNSSQGSEGYSGNNPVAKCPTGPNDTPTSAHCGSANYSYQDARRTAGNSNDYNGKLLRFNPLEIADTAPQPTVGPGSTYTLPTPVSPNGPNLFDGSEGGGGKAKPEIYAMGLRNPSRLSIDPETDVPYTAWVGPDATQPSGTLGPSTYENAAQVSRAGNYGWPYCMGNMQAYRDRLPDGSPRTANAPGYVNGGPATGGTAGWYDCDNLRNDSPNNTGLVEFPHQTGTGADAGRVRGNNLWYSRGNPGNADGCPDFERAAPGNAPDYSADPEQLCPYARNDGMTIMDGPVYRYDADASDNSKRWPEYWDGRWFLHNNGGPSIKHGLLLDPDTDQDGGLPIYADSLRNTLTWSSGSYMDSKFGPDGALYVQTYDGFFRAGENVSLYRYDYTGGPPTPSAVPKGVPIGAFRVQFSSVGSGGLSYLWEFGDGATSTEANPVHTYAEAKRYTARLTVTYADDSTATSTIDVDVLAEADETAPVTTAALAPAQPGPDGKYAGPVTVTLTATDAAGGSGVARTEYRLDGGDFQTYSGAITRSQPGVYTIEYRSSDRTGNVEATKTVSFEIKVPDNCAPNLNDEFTGPALDPKWQVLRGVESARSFADGRLRMLVRNGDMISGTATAKNVLLQDAPDGSWQATTKLDVSTLTNEGEQAGFVLWQRESPNTFAKVTYISKGGYSQWEWVATRNGEATIAAGQQFADAPDDVYLRVSSNGGGTYIAEGSFDGETWQQISGAITDLGDPATLKVGLKVSDNADTDHYAGFDFFRVDCSDKVAPTTTASLDDPAPDGELGWYTQAPEIALAADDGAGEGVAKISYRVDDEDLRDYDGPFTVAGDGEHEVTFFATDEAGNVETAKSLAFRVDGDAPVTTAEASIDEANARATVTLAGDDGADGSGVVVTEYRVDGGPWTVYESKAEQIFDGSASSLAQWRQAGPGRFDLLTDDSGGITQVDGLGMLWYPGKPYGDFRLKLQFREGRTTGHSNGGVFVRFPDPRQNPRVDVCARTGSAANEDAWVAIYCGHEIQLYDGPTGEVQKTGSVYNFDPVSTVADTEPGQWEDYEIEVRGQLYTIRRNGDVINTFENRAGIGSSRGGDPSTTLRQFARGYIGLQNHGEDDHLHYRDIRVEDLSPGARGVVEARPFTVSGTGPHTIEVRSIDAAGNVEAKQPFELEIGGELPPDDDGTPPVTVPLTPTAPVSTVLPAMIDTPASARLGKVGSRIGRATFGRRGLSVPIACTGAMDGSVRLTVSRATARKLKLARTTLDSEDVRCWGPHSISVRLKPSAASARRLAAKGGPKQVKLALTVQMRDFGRAPQELRRTVTLQR